MREATARWRQPRWINSSTRPRKIIIFFFSRDVINALNRYSLTVCTEISWGKSHTGSLFCSDAVRILYQKFKTFSICLCKNIDRCKQTFSTNSFSSIEKFSFQLILPLRLTSRCPFCYYEILPVALLPTTLRLCVDCFGLHRNN